MATALAPAALHADPAPIIDHPAKGGMPKLMLGAIGVVYGDIGTSPLYAMQATLDQRYHLGANILDLYGIVSLIFWGFVFVVTV